jgi:hypothetical protein
LERRDYKIGTTETEVRCRNSKSIAGNEFLYVVYSSIELFTLILNRSFLSFLEAVLAEKS